MKTPKYIGRTEISWRLRIRKDHKEFCKHYNFDKYGGVKHALYAAIEMRDRLLKEYGMLQYLDRKRSPDLRNKRQSSTYPCIGVYFADDKNWVATVQIDNRVTKKSFSVIKYGNELAFQLACEERFKRNGQLIIINKKALPCRPNVPYRIKAQKH